MNCPQNKFVVNKGSWEPKFTREGLERYADIKGLSVDVLIGALKDNNVAEIVGTTTFGKGVMQELVPISSGGALKLTIKEFCTPNGNKINKEGIKPDIEINDDEKTEDDEQLQKAIEECKK